jgi:hypothetical protein
VTASDEVLSRAITWVARGLFIVAVGFMVIMAWAVYSHQVVETRLDKLEHCIDVLDKLFVVDDPNVIKIKQPTLPEAP